jgi:hypothetical protein
MKVFTLPDGTTVQPQDQFQIGDQKYPPFWLSSASDAEIAAAGVTVKEVEDPPPPPPPPLALAALDFRRLFTDAETVAITQASQTNPQLRIFMDDESSAGIVHMDDPEVTGGVASLISAGLLTQERANAVLAGAPPPTA